MQRHELGRMAGSEGATKHLWAHEVSRCNATHIDGTSLAYHGGTVAGGTPSH